MQAIIDSGKVLPVTFEERGAEIQRRRLVHGMRSLREFAERAGVSREAVTNAERGSASEGTYLRLEAWLDAYDHELGADEPAPSVEQLVVVVDGDRVEVTVSGPIRDPAALEASVAKLVRGIREGSPERPTT